MLFVFYFQFHKKFLLNTNFCSLLLKLSLSVFLKYFLIFPCFGPHVSYILVSYRKICIVSALALQFYVKHRKLPTVYLSILALSHA